MKGKKTEKKKEECRDDGKIGTCTFGNSYKTWLGRNHEQSPPVSLFARSKHSKKLKNFVCAEIGFEDTKKLLRLCEGGGESGKFMDCRYD